MDKAEVQKFQKSLGRRICDVRRQKGWTQEQLAHESGLGRASMGAIERGEVSVRISSLLSLSQALGLPISELTKGIENHRKAGLLRTGS
jgi:transcriptional regulator with XRE-family HTH domain